MRWYFPGISPNIAQIESIGGPSQSVTDVPKRGICQLSHRDNRALITWY